MFGLAVSKEGREVAWTWFKVILAIRDFLFWMRGEDAEIIGEKGVLSLDGLGTYDAGE